MPRTVPASIVALKGQANITTPVWLMEWQLTTGTRYYSNRQQVTWNGQTWERNRIQSISGLTAQYIDRKTRDFGKLTITLDNLADDGSSNFPFQALDSAEIFEDKLIKIYCYFPDANDAVLFWWGFSLRPNFKSGDKVCELSASFLWDSSDLVVPTVSLQKAGFSILETNRNKDPFKEDTVVPLVYGLNNFKIRPTIYSARDEGGFFHINFIISGTATGLPFQTTDLTLGNVRLFDDTQAEVLEFTHVGLAADPVPDNTTRFPDGAAHNLVAYGYAAFRITDQIKDKLDNLKPEDIKLKLANGRPLIDTGLVSENPVLILKDILRDPTYGLGLSNAAFDATVITNSANYVAGKFQARLELHKRMPLAELVQRLLGEFHGFLTFNNGLVQIGVKTNAEASVETFAASTSGFVGLPIHDDEVDVSEKDFSELVNELTLSYRRKNRQEWEVIMFDPTAQARAGGTIKKIVDDSVELLTIQDETQVQICGAITLREEQNGDLFIEGLRVAIQDGIRVAPGDLITVRSKDIFNNASNFLFRVHSQTPDTGDEPLLSMSGQIYKPAIYDYSTAGIGTDLLRGSKDTSQQGRPPDVTPFSVQIKDVVANDTDGKLATVLAIWTYPVVDLVAEQADNIFREYPIGGVQLWWHYTDESPNEARMGKEIKYPTAQGEFQIDYQKNRSIKVWFVALGHNRSRSKLGYIPDLTKVTAMNASIPAGAGRVAYDVVSNSLFNVNDLIIVENEINRIQSKPTALLVVFADGTGNRQTFFDTVRAAHPNKTEIAVAKESYPSLTLPLTAPRFTYKTVTGVVARQKKDGVRVKWADPDRAIVEEFGIAWSSDADAGTNPAKLGVATPSWYSTNPESPPVGVNITWSKDRDKLIDQADIGSAGTTIFIRVFAKNGKHNFSPQMSALVSNSSAGGDTPPTDAPSTPTLALIISQGPNLATAVADSLDVHRVFASQADNSKTFAQTGTPELVLVFRDQGSIKDDPFVYVLDDLSVTSVDVPVIGTLGKARTHRRTIAKNSAGSTKSPVVAINYFAGGKVTSLAGITGLVITSISPVQNTKGRQSEIFYSFTQPNPSVLIAKAIAMQKNAAEASFSKEKKENLLDEEFYQQPGPKTDSIRVSHPKNDAGQYKIRLVSVDGTFIESPIFNSTSQDEDTAPPNNGVAITIGTPKLKNGSFLMVPYTVPTVQMNTYEKTVVQIHDNNETLTGRKFYNFLTSAWVTTDPELQFAQHTRVAHRELFVGGRTRVYVRIGIRNRFNGGSTTYSSDLAAFIDSSFVAGNPSEPDDVPQDTTAPANLNTPILDFSRGLFAKMSMSGVTQVNTLKLVEATISNGVNSLNLNSPSLETLTAGADVFYPLAKQSPKFSLPISKRKLRKLFGQSGSIYVKFRLTNDRGSTTSAASTNLALDTIIDVTPPTDDNQLWNGHFVYLESAGTLANWQAYQPAGGNSFNILDIGTGRLRYQDNEHRAKFQVNPVSDLDTNKRWLVQYVGDLLRGSFYAGYFLILADGNRTVDFDIFIATINGGTRQVESLDFNGNKNPINVTTSLVANVPKRIEYEFRYATDAVTTLRTYFVVRLNSRVDAGLGDAFVYVDEFQLNPGRVVGPFTTRRLKEQNVQSTGPQASGGTANLNTGEEFGTAATSVNLGVLIEAGEGGSGLGRGVVY